MFIIFYCRIISNSLNQKACIVPFVVDTTFVATLAESSVASTILSCTTDGKTLFETSAVCFYRCHRYRIIKCMVRKTGLYNKFPITCRCILGRDSFLHIVFGLFFIYFIFVSSVILNAFEQPKRFAKVESCLM